MTMKRDRVHSILHKGLRPFAAAACMGTAALLAIGPGHGLAQAEEASIRINPSGSERYRIAVTGSASVPVVTRDLELSGYFRVLDPKSFPAALSREARNKIDPQAWMQVGSQGVAKVEDTSSGLNGQLFEVSKGDSAVLTQSYSGVSGRQAAHRFAAAIVEHYTGEQSFFGSQIAFSMPGRKGGEIYTMDFDGNGVRPITEMRAPSLLPSWSPSGKEVVFLSYLFGTPDLWTVPSSGGRARRLTRGRTVVSGASFSPDGSKMAVAISQDGNVDIFLLDNNGAILRRLTSDPGIDTSPAFSPDGTQIAFVSNRLGNPQIFVMNSDGSSTKRLTYQGTYNQTPKWCPRKDLPWIAFTARDEKYQFDIFVLDAKTGKIERLTENQGKNEEPSWAPNCRAITYQSSRGGIFLMSLATKTEHLLLRGRAESPRFSPPMAR